jgi:hypothetical protein
MRALLVLPVVIAAGAVAIGLRSGAADCPDGVRTLRVAATPEMATVVRAAADRATEGGDAADCRRVDVQALASAEVLDELSRSDRAPSEGTPAEGAGSEAAPADGPRPDVWIPDSSVWIGRAADAGVVPASQAAPIATSPVVLAVPAASAKRLGWPRRPLDFPRLLGTVATGRPVQVGFPDPDRSAPAVAALLGLQRAATQSHVRGELAAMLRSADLTLGPDVERRLGRGSLVLPVSEQAVWAYNAVTRPPSGAPLVAAYPAGPGTSLDYPFLVLSEQPATTVDAARLLAALQDETGRALLASRGFRSPGGAAGAALREVVGVHAAARVSDRVPTMADLAAARTILGTLNRGSRLLAVLDVSGSMATPVPGTRGRSRMDLTKRAAAGGLSLLPADSRVGLWEFSTNLTRRTDYRRLVPIGPMEGGRPGTGRRAMAAAISRVEAIPDGATGLYDTTLAAVRAVRAHYDPRRVNAVVLLSDGANQDQSGLDLEQLLDRLRAGNDPARPVPVIAVAYGPDSDAAALRAISDVTGGATYVAADPRQIRQVFLDAIGQRLCRPDCPAAG